MEGLWKILVDPQWVIMAILFIIFYYANKREHSDIKQTMEFFVNSMEKITKTMEKYVFEFKEKDDEDFKDIVNHIEYYVLQDFASIEKFLLKYLTNDFLKRHCKKDEEKILNFLTGRLSKKIIGSTQQILLEEGYSKNILLKIEETDNLIFPSFIDKVQYIIKIYLKGNLNEENIFLIKEKINVSVEYIQTKWMKTFEKMYLKD